MKEISNKIGDLNIMEESKNKYLTVGQLKKILDNCVDESNKDCLVVIDSKPLSSRSYIGASPSTCCMPFAGFGIDWDSEKFLIFPSETLYFNDVDRNL